MLINKKGLMTKVVLDTDMGNEIDDMFALVYVLSSMELDLQAITIEPFSGSPLYPDASLSESIEISCLKTKKILEYANRNDLLDKVFPGAEKYYKDSQRESNSAVESMARILHEDMNTVIAAIGTPVNVALLFSLYPELAETTKVVWLGGNGLGYSSNREFNFSQDLEADRKLFSSCKNLTVIPCKNIASNLSCSEPELNLYLSGSVLGDYLLDQFVLFRDVVFGKKAEMGYSKILWDVSVVAFLVNNAWFCTVSKECVCIKDDETYGFDGNDNRISFVSDVSRNPIMIDFFTKTNRFCFLEKGGRT